MKSEFLQILEKIISDRMNIRILKIIKDVKDYCSSSVRLGLPMQMIRILKMYLKVLHVNGDIWFPQKADLRAEDANLVSRPGYLGVAYHVAGVMDFDVEIDVPGTFSVYNSLTAIAVCRHFDVPKETIQTALKKAKVKGQNRDGESF